MVFRSCLMIMIFTFIFAFSLPLLPLSFVAVEGRFVVAIKHSSSKSPALQVIREEEKMMVIRGQQLGSRPPRCDEISKCRTCGHCQAIQVPTTSSSPARREDYSDYKPMRWKCKCGSSLFNP